MLDLSTKREYTFKQDTEFGELTFTFKFKYVEDKDYSTLLKLVTESKDEKDYTKKLRDNYLNIEYKSLRKCLIGCTGISIDGKEVKIIDRGVIDKKAQKDVFDYIVRDKKLYGEIKEAQEGINSKNS